MWGGLNEMLCALNGIMSSRVCVFVLIISLAPSAGLRAQDVDGLRFNFFLVSILHLYFGIVKY